MFALLDSYSLNKNFIERAKCHIKTTNQLTRNDITSVQTKLTALQNLIRPIRFRGLVKSLLLIILLLRLLIGIEIRCDYLQIMVMSLMYIPRYVDVPIKRSRRLQETSWGILQSLLNEIFGKGLTETQVINDMRNICHVRGEVVITRLGLNVKVAGCTVYQ